MPAEPTLRLRQADLAWREFGTETVLIDLRTSTYLETNAAATLLWRRLESGATESALVEALVDAFAIAPEQAATDVRAFVTDCERRGLLS